MSKSQVIERENDFSHLECFYDSLDKNDKIESNNFEPTLYLKESLIKILFILKLILRM